ncbi:Protein of unknown function [Lactobacillus delbrueckii subsp. lactis]|nr:Putative uncharacterized protein [Lactobacillus delbrueckii subsp. lactis]CDR84070.1 Protein of unknown function [Lactobacillus delbrueckii subsp. lactis]
MTVPKTVALPLGYNAINGGKWIRTTELRESGFTDRRV